MASSPYMKFAKHDRHVNLCCVPIPCSTNATRTGLKRVVLKKIMMDSPFTSANLQDSRGFGFRATAKG
jgi:hypothetical protein